MTTKKRYAQVGVGHRSLMYSEAAVERFRDTSDLVALGDTNEGRLRLRADWVRERGVAVKTYPADQFERMIAETKPDVVIVTTMDSTHDAYICRAMELGCDVITEKPMTTDEVKCQRILDTQKKTGRKCTVAFNYRYAMPRTQVKELLMSGVIGNVVAVDFHWLLDTRHGADYFRRWHRNKRNSGGLLVHKATHHFDLVNWWLSTVPQTVYATGARNFYRPATAERYGLTYRGERCHGCLEASRCPFYLDLEEYPDLKSIYLDNEKFDEYYRDRCVFSDQIDIEDTIHVNVGYRNGALMSYSLHSFMPWEGYVVAFNGTQGRLEHSCQESVYISGDGSMPGELISEGTKIKVFPHFQSGYEVEIRQTSGGHGGADPLLLKDLFDPDSSQDAFKRAADQRAGAWSILTGIAANHSIARGARIQVDDLVRSLDEPDYTPMPDPCEPIDSLLLKRSTASRVKS
ncbi:MAG: Gfo/Idh/MocA family oxidoreductase [Chloroflexi bacterium]|nr:Gfo/Idh/MocA family oxidoreductase [Chloroflexota bacterium]